MNKEKRSLFLELANMTHGGLCNFCKFADWSGNSCCDSELECTHPLEIIYENDHPYNVWEGSDCWAFRPNCPLEEIAIKAGITMQGNIPIKNRRGEIVAIIPSENDKKYI